ncbi:MAG: GntR family transcriptional regulator [Geobacter sp.]|uniref:GntR family transcriptional regulator n=1 Tax=Geomonas ferrireducens TaxID=2570227 RepID=UPI0010A91E14|nr:GntR family transcriptional regulator [Geomonas ferrireducens]TSK07289.1 MAG: GntR family transcriptional regulator [Geobacter sp.]
MNESLTEAETSSLSLSDRIFEQLQTAIVKGAIPAGSKISEPELAKTFGISRGTLREALSRLEERYLVVRSPNLGARVVTLSYEELIDIYQVREALGGMACGLAAVNMTDEEIADLGRLLDDHEKSIREDQGLSYYQQEGEFDFHYRILLGSRNRKVISILEGGLYQLMRMYRYQFSTSSPRPLLALKEHRRIVEALAERDAELADLLMRRHISAARKSIEERRRQSLEQKG